VSSFQDSSWLRRLWSLATPGDPVAQFVQNANLVNDRRYASSRERAPYAAHNATIPTGGAGVHNFIEIGGLDLLGPTTNFLHFLRTNTDQSSGALAGFLSWNIAAAGSLTAALRLAQTPQFRDTDPDVAPTLFVGNVATANLPAGRTIVPKNGSVGETSATPSFSFAVTVVEPTALPFARTWNTGSLFIFAETADTLLNFDIVWQAMRS
jgi:hypothetical protein